MKSEHDRLYSERLVLRRYRADDLDALDRLNRDPAVMRYMGGPASRADSEAMLRHRILAYYRAHPGLGIWAVEERDGGACIGMHLLNHIQGEPYVQVGYRLYPECWGRGYGTEMARRLLRYGFETLGLPRIVAITHLDNRESQHVLLKSGLERRGERTVSHPGYGGAPLAWFERDRAGWLATAPAVADPQGKA